MLCVCISLQLKNKIKCLRKQVIFHDYVCLGAAGGKECKVYMLKFIEYPKCSTCIKARKYLDQLGLKYTRRHIVDEKLNKEELLMLYKKSGLPLKRFFNTSGLKYRELNLKDKLSTMSEDEQLTLLASDGMLVKRPIIETDNCVLVGFKTSEYDGLK